LWRKWLHDGFIPNTALPTKTVSAKSDVSSSLSSPNPQPPTPNTLELVFRPDPSIYDGRFANNGWLQELPRPLTKITWDNVALVSSNTAKKLGLAPQAYEERDHGRECYVDTIKITLRNQTIAKAVPAWIMPGQPDDVIGLYLGYGRNPVGKVWDTITDPDTRLPQGGFNAYDIRFADQPWSATGASVSKTAERFLIASTQAHFLMTDPEGNNRDILRVNSIDEYEREREHIAEKEKEQKKENKELSLYPEVDYKNQGNGYAWGMS